MQVFPPFLQKVMFFLVFALSVTAVVTIFYTLFINVNQTQIAQNPVALLPTASPTYPPMIFPTETTAPTEIILPSVSISPTITPTLESIPRLSTVGWRSVSNSDVSFLIPPDASCTGGDENCTSIVTTSEYEGHTVSASRSVSVEPYEGGSRREQFLNNHGESFIESCNPLFVDSLFGSVNALQIAADGGCYDAGAIIAVVGDKMIIFWSLAYDDQSKEILRSPIRDTIISTVTN